ncbi:alkaline phosphatase D family protein [Thalassoglobus polymorphus]|uniref:alkaline phosphatase D family protein n=1 Tax=Thalassoglobus polymorphus TaxID=2527994 RepID=UPI001E3ED139|nr:alkaline phosphatase D family protein [Thalassoglobus polymorphus]
MSHRLFYILSLSIFLVGCAKDSSNSSEADPSDKTPDSSLMAGQGIMVGELTDQSAFVQVRLTQGDQLIERDLPGVPGVVKFTLSQGDTQIGDAVTVQALETYDFIARSVWDGLSPGTEYTCKTEIGADENSLQPGPTATFSTLYGAELNEPLSFVVVTGMNFAKFHGDDRIDLEQHKIENNRELPEPYSGPDKHLGYPALNTILKKKPLFFVGTGDNVYYDTPDNPRAETVKELRQKWHEQFRQPRFISLFAAVPTYWEVDDHDYRIDDGDNSGDYKPTPETARRMMLEQLPIAAHGDENVKTYRTHRISKDLQLWFTEGRIYRSDNAAPDGPEKTIWGEEQKEWLKKTLVESDAAFKILISPTPMIGPDDLRKTDNHTNVGGFQHERDEFFDWLNESGVAKQNFYIVCGDRHWQYHSIHPSGIEEFSSGALIDENSRPGRLPGDPKSTDPEGTIKQPYSQREASGGFLEIQLTPQSETGSSKLAFLWNDEHGEIQHEEVKTAD